MLVAELHLSYMFLIRFSLHNGFPFGVAGI